MPSLLLGCGHSREKKLFMNGQKDWIGPLVTLDIGTNVGADVVFDMNKITIAHPDVCMSAGRLPFEDEYFDEIGSFDTMEHWGRQGDWKGWFAEWSEYHRILKPGGKVYLILPINDDALCDPGHVRFLHHMWFGFLNQKFYEENLAKNTAVTDYRWYWKKSFKAVHYFQHENHHFSIVMEKE